MTDPADLPDAHRPPLRSADGSPPGDTEWDDWYGAADQLWSGEPNGALVAEVAELTLGTALDVGCGEGADAVWLARRGWQVTALDVSAVALRRAESQAQAAGVDVRWLCAGLLEADLGTYDLVSAQYPALRKNAAHDAERALLTAVAPGGTLLVVHHANVDPEHAKANGFDPAEYVSPADVAALLGDGWHVQIDVETRARHVLPSSAGAHHTDDIVLRAVRLR